MQHPTKLSAGLLAAIVLAAGFVSISWFQNPAGAGNGNGYDTLPKREKKVRAQKDKEKHATIISGDIDKQMEQFDKALDNLDKQLENKDWGKINQQLRESLGKLDVQKMEQQINEAMKRIDEQKIRLQVEQELAKVDWNKTEADIRKAIDQAKNSLDGEKLQSQLQKALEESKAAMAEVKNIDMDKVRQGLNEAREQLKAQQGRLKEEIERARLDIQKNLDHNIKDELEKAKADILRSKEAFIEYKTMMNEMAKDGLLNSKENNKVEYKNGELFINGKQQPANIRDKYKSYFKQDGINIQQENDGQNEDENDNDDAI